MNTQEIAELEQSIEQMTEIAVKNGLDFYPMRFEVCPSDIIYTFGAYGMPTRFSHWSFGKSFHRMRLEYEFGLSRIYELVINSDPCYAFLLDGNTLLQNKTVCAHVLAHCDFFKNNATFRHTSRDMVERMASSAERIRQYEIEHGRARVEELLDAGLALQEHIDATAIGRNARAQKWEQQYKERHGIVDSTANRSNHSISPYHDLWALDLDGQTKEQAEQKPSKMKLPLPQKDVMLFLIEHSSVLHEWERDILSILREEMLYFWPQLETKIMNEGWGSFSKGAFKMVPDKSD